MKRPTLWLIALTVALTMFSPLRAFATGRQESTQTSTTTPALAKGKYQESPTLSKLVQAGTLPSVEKRLPDEPAVLKPIDGVGKYGGTLRVFALNNFMWGDVLEEPERGNYLLRMNMDGSIEPDIAKNVVLADDAKSLTVYLRPGMKWSDGALLTADDFIFMWEGMHWNGKIETWGAREFVKRVRKIDDSTVRFEFDEPHPEFYLNQVEWRGSELVAFHPKHYLAKWHISYNPDADTVAKNEGFTDWLTAFRAHYWWSPLSDIKKPTTQPWVMTQFTTTTKVFDRNPYYHMVDTAGNQLPYVDKVISTIVDQEAYNLKVISGEADVAFANTSMANYTLYKENEKAGGYRVVSIPGINGSEVYYGVNQTHKDPVMRALFQDIRFRRALSLAMNRDEINKVAFFGLAVPRQATVLPSVSYYKPEWGEKHPYARFAPDEANRLLDQMGLTARDRDGFRLRPDGKQLDLVIETSNEGEAATNMQVNELVKDYWRSIGLRTEINSMSASLFTERGQDVDHEIRGLVFSNTGEFYSYVSQAWMWSPIQYADGWGRAWGIWLDANRAVTQGTKKLSDFDGGKLPGEEPPQDIKNLWDLIYNRFSVAPYGSTQFKSAAQELFQFHSDKLYMIGTVGLAPTLYIARTNIGNVPTRYPPQAEANVNLNYYTNQLFFK